MRAAIIGLFNSGSSVISQIVECLGAEIGRPLWEEHFESRSLRSALVEWWCEPRLVEQVRQEDRITFLQWWAEYYESLKPVVCAKHPLLCLSARDLDVAWGSDYREIRSSRPLQKSIERLTARGWYRDPTTCNARCTMPVKPISGSKSTWMSSMTIYSVILSPLPGGSLSIWIWIAQRRMSLEPHLS